MVFLCNSKEEKIIDISSSPNGTTRMLTLLGTSKILQNINVTNIGGLLVQNFVRQVRQNTRLKKRIKGGGGGLKPLC